MRAGDLSDFVRQAAQRALNAVSYQVHTLVTALLAFHNRTGADLTAWFGNHDLPRNRRHLAQAA